MVQRVAALWKRGCMCAMVVLFLGLGASLGVAQNQDQGGEQDAAPQQQAQGEQDRQGGQDARESSGIQELIDRAAAQAGEGNYAEALKSYNRAVERAPQNAELRFNRGVVAYDAGRLESAARDFSKAIELNPEYGQAFFNRGNVRYLQESYQQALEDYGQAVSLLEEDRSARLNRGLARYQTGAYEDALADFDAVLAALGDGAGTGGGTAESGTADGRPQGDSADAPARGTQAAQLEGASRVDVRYYRANTYFQLERYRQAVEDYRAVIEAQPENADAMHNLGMAYIRLAERMEEENNQ